MWNTAGGVWTGSEPGKDPWWCSQSEWGAGLTKKFQPCWVAAKKRKTSINNHSFKISGLRNTFSVFQMLLLDLQCQAFYLVSDERIQH